MKKTAIITALVLALLVAAGCDSGAPASEKQIDNITREEKTKPGSDAPQQTQDGETVTEGEQREQEQTEPVQTEPENVTKSAVELSAVLSEIKTAVSAQGAMDLDAQAISSLYSIDGADISQAAGFVVMAGTFPHEAVMVEAKDSASADRVEKMLKAKYDAFVQQSKGYDAANYALAQKCRVERYGNHISMFLTPDFETMKSVYVKYVK